MAYDVKAVARSAYARTYGTPAAFRSVRASALTPLLANKLLLSPARKCESQFPNSEKQRNTPSSHVHATCVGTGPSICPINISTPRHFYRSTVRRTATTPSHRELGVGHRPAVQAESHAVPIAETVSPIKQRKHAPSLYYYFNLHTSRHVFPLFHMSSCSCTCAHAVG